MTMTTELAAPQVPAWLNIGAVFDSADIQKLSELLLHALEVRTLVVDLAAHVIDNIGHLDAKMQRANLPDDVSETARKVSGYDGVWDLLRSYSDLLESALDNNREKFSKALEGIDEAAK